jgi:hypothetical protein
MGWDGSSRRESTASFWGLLEKAMQVLNIFIGDGGTGVNEIKAWLCVSASAGILTVCGLNVSPQEFLDVHV